MAQKKKVPVKRVGPGRPTHKELGLDPKETVTMRLETKVIDLAKKKYGSLSNAIRAAVGF